MKLETHVEPYNNSLRFALKAGGGVGWTSLSVKSRTHVKPYYDESSFAPNTGEWGGGRFQMGFLLFTRSEVYPLLSVRNKVYYHMVRHEFSISHTALYDYDSSIHCNIDWIRLFLRWVEDRMCTVSTNKYDF